MRSDFYLSNNKPYLLRVFKISYFPLFMTILLYTVVVCFLPIHCSISAGRPGSSEVPRNPLTRWDVSSIPANGIFLTKKLKNKTKNAQRVEND